MLSLLRLITQRSKHTLTRSTQKTIHKSPMKRKHRDRSTTPNNPAATSLRATSPRRKKMAASTLTIKLTDREKQLRGLLVDVASYIDGLPAKPASEPLVLRWAGGWVRDKLLGKASDDIDTAINAMNGFPFATHLRDFCGDPSNVKRHQLTENDIGSLHKVAANPDKSKHLETATCKVFGVEVDFVNLRKETYADDSRNPVVEFGTAEEDALRRDATINALFYNLHSGEVEDFTKRGIEDMKKGIMRTPLEPLKTFMDDPLRVLRLVRFASRLGFKIDPEAEKVMGDERVLEALRVKICRERVGIEMRKMLTGNDPAAALEFIDRLGLYHVVFTDPNIPSPKPDTSNWKAAYECLAHLKKTNTPKSLYEMCVRSTEAEYIAWLLAAVAPFELKSEEGQSRDTKESNTAQQMFGKKHAGLRKGAPCPAAVAAREGLKEQNKVLDVIADAHRNRSAIVELKDAVCSGADYIQERDRFGMAIRAWNARSSWQLQVLHAVLVDVMERQKSIDDRDGILMEWQKFIDHLVELDVTEAPNLKRIIDGLQLARALGLKPGRWTGKALDVTTAWQLRNPKETDPSGAIEEVKSRGKELEIPGF